MGLALLVSGLWMVYRANVFGFGKSMSYPDYQAVDTTTPMEEIRTALGKPDTIGGPFAEAGGRLVEVWFYLESVKRSDGTRCDVTFEVETYGENGRVTGKALGGCN